MAESEEALQLKRRARRRLIGAIALVTFVVIVLPLILDKEPGPAGPPLSVQIPNQEASGFNSRIVPSAPVAPVAPATEKQTVIAPAKAEAPSAKEAPPAAMAERSAPSAAAGGRAPKAEAMRAQSSLNDESWVVMLDAFSDEKNVRQLRTKLSAAGVKSYTESVKTSKGELTRVRAGPFASKEAAEKARAKLAGMGLKPGAVASR
jgi:DedD protein